MFKKLLGSPKREKRKKKKKIIYLSFRNKKNMYYINIYKTILIFKKIYFTF